MAKAELVLPNGTKVAIDGTVEEVKELLSGYSWPAAAPGRKPRAPRRGPARPKGASSARPSGLTAQILGLRDADYFKEKRTGVEVKAKLAEGGHHYSLAAVSQTLLNLTRAHEVRRIKENVAASKGKGKGKKNKVYVYVR